MSQSLHTSDYMSIFGEITKLDTATDGSEMRSPARLNLHFSVQVNGKLKTFTHFLQLQEKTTGGPGECKYELKDYRVWYAIVETLGELGYPIGEYNKDAPLAMNFISQWVEDCEEELNSKGDCFYR